MDELREREESGRRLGVDTDGAGRLRGSGGRVLIVDDNERQARKMVEHLAAEHRPTVESDPAAALIAARGPVDLVIVNVTSEGFDGLRFVAQTRSTEASRRVPILAVVDPSDRTRLLKALELGVNDILPRPVDLEELEARSRSQIKRKRHADFLKQKLDYSLEMAVTDALTGLHNRRYMAGQLQALMGRAGQGAIRWPCWSWTSTISNWSTTASAMTPATRCCASSRCGWPPMCAPSTCRAVWAARSSWS